MDKLSHKKVANKNTTAKQTNIRKKIKKNKIKNTQIIKIDLSPILCSLYSETLFCQLNIRLKYCLHICVIKMTKPQTLTSEY